MAPTEGCECWTGTSALALLLLLVRLLVPLLLLAPVLGCWLMAPFFRAGPSAGAPK
ncbi:hypothetical protein GCM10010329_65810 [Streptomyces spiroverticillatus]|nr:hypothetical protein GCM10010329_65810 [Streptomyces spiroverticillatus]